MEAAFREILDIDGNQDGGIYRRKLRRQKRRRKSSTPEEIAVPGNSRTGTDEFKFSATEYFPSIALGSGLRISNWTARAYVSGPLRRRRLPVPWQWPASSRTRC
jgi:hypothetical protein